MSIDPETARAQLLEFRMRVYGINSDGQIGTEFEGYASNLRSAIEQLSTGLYQQDIHFVFELIQNAEDNEYGDRRPELRFQLLADDPTHTPGSEGCLCVFNNENGFEWSNVQSICQIGQSTKSKKLGYIGEKGIGFKSVFLVSSAPHIFSNGYRFNFREQDPQIPLHYVVPYWVEDVPDVVSQEASTTTLLLPLKPGKQDQVKKELGGIAPEVLLFLNKLERLSFSGDAFDGSRVLERQASTESVMTLSVVESGETKSTTQYWVESCPFQRPSSLVDEKRHDVTESVVTAAFPLDDAQPAGGVFAFLPTEARSNLPFIVNADFILATTRESIQIDRPWNKWLRDCLADQAIAGLRAMQKEEELATSWYKYIPIKQKASTRSEFFDLIRQRICEAFCNEECILSEDGSTVRPDQARLATKEQRALFEDKPRPDAFESIYLVDRNLQSYSRQLKELGVRELSNAEMVTCISERQWLETRQPRWFINLYRAIHEGHLKCGKRLWRLPLLLTSTGDVAARNETEVLVAATPDEAESLSTRVSRSDLPKVTLLHPHLVMGLNTDPTLFKWIEKTFNLRKFSVSRYIDGQLVPWLQNVASNSDIRAHEEMSNGNGIRRDTNAQESSKRLGLSAASLVAEKWHQLDDDARESLRHMPIVLDKEELVTREWVEDRELVVPEGFDRRSGWHFVFSTSKDREHIAVLAKEYLTITMPEDAERGELFDALRASRKPKFAYRTFHWNSVSPSDPDSEYARECMDEISLWTESPSFETYVAPRIFSQKKPLTDKRVRNAFIKILEKHVKESDDDLRDGWISWFYRSPQVRRMESAIHYRLTNISWVNTTKGRKRPGETFRESEQLVEIFGRRLPYLKDEFSLELCSFLGIKEEATTKTVIDYLRELSVKGTKPSPRAIVDLYRFLDHYGKDVQESFEDEPLIWVPGEGRAWWKTSEVFWHDASEALSDVYGYLEPVYGSIGLRDFFVRKLSVSEVANPEKLVSAWEKLPDRDDLDHERIENAFGSILTGIRAIFASGKDRPDWWLDRRDGLQVWTWSKEFVAPDQCFINDDLKLYNLFGRELEFVWHPDRLSQTELDPLYSDLGVRRLSEATEVELEGAENPDRRTPALILTDWSKRLLGYLLWNRDPEKYRELAEAGLLRKLLAAEEVLAEQVTIRYVLPDSCARDRVEDVSSFWDENRERLILQDETDNEEQRDSVAETLARAIWVKGYKRRIDDVLAILAVLGEERFRQIRDRRGWHMPSTEQKRINDWIRTPKGSANEEDEVPKGGNDEEKDTDNGAKSDKKRRGEPPRGKQPSSSARERLRSENDSGASRGGRRQKGYASENSPSGQRRSRSKGLAQKLNNRPQRRVVTYVEARQTERDASSEAGDREMGDRAEAWVAQYEETQSRKVRRMDINNPGYDIESFDPDTGEVRFIEVKGIGGEWGERGVGLSSRQYEFAREKGDDFWLYVLESVDQPQPRLHRIQNPANRITHYQFDANWVQLSIEEQDYGAFEETRVTLDPVAELQSYTTDASCREIVARCARDGYPFPEIGYEILGEDGAVIGDVELAWEGLSLVVVLADTDPSVIEALERNKWHIVRLDELEDGWRELVSRLQEIETQE